MADNVQELVCTPVTKPKYSWKFYTGIVLIIVSLIIGLIFKVLFLFYLGDFIIMWLLIIIYILSWPMMILGIWWVGKEYADKIRKYADYRYYHQSLKDGTRRLHNHGIILKTKVRDHLVNVHGKLKKKKK